MSFNYNFAISIPYVSIPSTILGIINKNNATTIDKAPIKRGISHGSHCTINHRKAGTYGVA